MDVIEHYIKTHALCDIPAGFGVLLDEAIQLPSLLRGDGRMNIFIDKLEDGSLEQVDGKGKISIQDRTLWKRMKKELLAAKSAEQLDHWKGTGGDFKTLTGVSLSAVDKKVNGLATDRATTPSGEDWEAMIVVGVAINDKKNPEIVCVDEWTRVEKKWADPYIEPALKIAKEFKKKGLVPVTQSGTSQGTLSKDWSSWRDIAGGIKNKTAKTDLDGGGKKISLKMAGGSQAMSAKNGEAIATFFAACDILGKDSPGEVTKIIDRLKNGVMTMDSDKDPYKGEIRPLDKDLKTLSIKGKDSFDTEQVRKLGVWKKRLDRAREDGEYITNQMNTLFSNNPKFKDAFVFEASSGFCKFGNSSPARADQLVEFNAKTGSISAEYSMSDQNDTIKKLSSLFNFYMSFKSSSGSSAYMALRGNLMKKPKDVPKEMPKSVNEVTEFGDVCPTFSTIVKEGLAQNPSMKMLLTESPLDNINEVWKIVKKVIDGVKSVGKSAKDKFVQMWNWIKERVEVAFDWIKKQGRKALQFLLKFFGIELEKCGLSGGPFELFSD
jgi:hypothetical protein